MDTPIRVTAQLGPHLKSLRKARGLSQSALGKIIGVGQTRITEIEANPGLVNLEQLMKVFRALDVELVLRGSKHELDQELEKSNGTALHRAAHKGTW